MPRSPRQVFISYAQSDQELARRLADELRRAGASPWLDVEHLRPGDSLSDVVRRAIDTSDAYVLLIGSHQSHWMRFEWSEVLKRTWADRSHVVVPVLIDDAVVPGYLRDRVVVRVDSRTGRGIEQVAAHLAGDNVPDAVRTPEGEARLSRRLAELEQAAAELVEPLEEPTA